MREFLVNLFKITSVLLMIAILSTAIVLPFALAWEENPPYWLAWIIYPLTLVIMAGQKQMLNYLEKL